MPDTDAVEGTEYSQLRVEHDGPLTWIVFNRPERLNALSSIMLRELEGALSDLERRRATRVIIIRGEGRAFCSGYDIDSDGEEIGEAAERNLVTDRHRLERNVETFMAIWKHPKPVIAAVHGYCIAGGAQLATLCDLTVIAEDTKIGVPSIPIGGGYISPMWVPLVGPKRAKQLSFQAGTHIDGKTAAEWGWANYAVPAEELIDNVTELALSIALTPADVLSVKKAAVNRAADLMSWSTIMPLGAETDALLHGAESIRYIQERIMEHGMKETIRRFKDGEFRSDLDRIG